MKLLLLMLLANDCLGYRLLGFFPFPTKSHHQTFSPVMFELARRGHEVVYLTSITPDFSHPNCTVVMIPDFRTKFLEAFGSADFGSFATPVQTFLFSQVFLKTVEEYYGSKEAQAIIHGNDTFDAVLMESHYNQEAVSAFIHKFGCPAIELSSMGEVSWLNEISGLPDNTAYMMDFKTAYPDDMTLWERVGNTFSTWTTTLINYYHLWRMQSVMDKYFNYTGWETRPSIYKLISNKSMILINRDIVLNYPYPEAPHVKDIGGINLFPNKPLPKNMESFMDEATDGVILFSLGSIKDTTDLTVGPVGKAILNVFSRLPHRIIMKWESEVTVKLPPNILTSKWLPQQDILAHKNCILFITHGGYNSILESIYHSVPVVGIPFFSDQYKNMKQVLRAGIGVELRYNNITEDSLSWAIDEVIKNPSYKEETAKRARMIRERPRSAGEEAVYWIEFAIKYPNALTPRAAFLSFFQVHLIDVYSIMFLAIFIVYKFILVLISFITRKRSVPKQKIS